MRDLSRFGDASFDIVWQAHSINFVPDPRPVFSEVWRVLGREGLYRLQFTNPFIHGTWEKSWTGTGYLLAGPYRDAEVPSDEPWTIPGEAGSGESETQRVSTDTRDDRERTDFSRIPGSGAVGGLR